MKENQRRNGTSMAQVTIIWIHKSMETKTIRSVPAGRFYDITYSCPITNYRKNQT